MKKSLRSLLAFLIAATVLCCIAMADTGPKPSASFTFTGMPDEDYYVTMLAEVDAYGPHRVHQPGSEIPGYVLEQGEQDPAYPAWQKFVDYKDPDGYYFLEDLFEQCHGDDEAGWRYFPPERFKLLLYFPESDTFLCSPVTARYAFDSIYRLDLGGKSPAEIAALTLTGPDGDPIPSPAGRSPWIKPTARISRSSVSSGGWASPSSLNWPWPGAGSTARAASCSSSVLSISSPSAC